VLCRRCKKHEASFLFQEVVEGRIEESGLCASCLEEDQPGFFIGGHPIASLLASLGAPVHKGKRLQCSNCGLAYAEFRKRGRLGCPGCYDAFADMMDEVLTEVHGCARHSGKRPPPLDPEDVRRAIEDAVSHERFEEAARLRDRLKKMDGA
jgi:protein arginine kinase activator